MDQDRNKQGQQDMNQKQGQPGQQHGQHEQQGQPGQQSGQKNPQSEHDKSWEQDKTRKQA